MDPCLAPVALLLSLNATAAAATALDEARARRGRRRVPEATLHLLALVGGGLGSIATLLTLRHKSRKPSFLAPHAAAAVLGLAAWIWILARVC